MRALVFLFLLVASPTAAQVLVAAAPIRSATVITAEHLAMSDALVSGGIGDPALVIGQEARVNIYAGRPILLAEIGPPALVERNALVVLRYSNNLLSITTEGRALNRAGMGEMVRVMNLSSRIVVVGRVRPDGEIEVGL
ncbi:MAG: flagellar basal body P-ring formation chaperone FlgA [Paracoccaceae bacterium]